MKIEYNMGQIEQFLIDFNKITHLNVCMYDAEMRVLYSPPLDIAELCTCIWKNKTGRMRCVCSEVEGLRKAAEVHRSIYSYRCHAGMVENVVPIFFESEIVGYIIFGQMLDGTENEIENIQKCCTDLFNDKETLTRLIDRLKVRKADYVESVARILQLCIQSSLHENMIMIRKDAVWLKIDQYIEENLNRKLTIEEIAQHAYCSQSTVSHKIRKVTGMSVCELIKQRRLFRAVALLDSTDYNISEIASMVGIEDYNYFSRIFRSFYGYSPSEYRKSIRR